MRRLFSCVAVAGAMAGLAVNCNAASIQFAQFSQQTGGASFAYTNGAFPLVPDTLTGNAVATIPINFFFQNPLGGYSLPITQNVAYKALLTITASSSQPALFLGQVIQNFDTLSFTIKPQVLVQNGTTFGAGDVILAGTNSDPTGSQTLTAGLGGNGATFQSADVFGFNFLTFSSTVIGVDPLSVQDAAAFSFSGVNPPITLAGVDLQTFTASGTGTFSSSAVPEPGTMSMVLGMVVSGTAFAGLRRRRSA